MNVVAGPNSALATYVQNLSPPGFLLIASDLQHAWNFCQSNENAPKFIAVYNGEQIRGDFSVAARNHRVDMQFSLVISRNRALTPDRAMSLSQDTGNARPLWSIVSEARDLIRGLVSQEFVEWPVDYKGINQWDVGPAWIVDAYVINFSIPADLPWFSDTPTEGPSPLTVE